MKHDSSVFQRIREYFLKRKSRRDARAFELEMESDAFLYEAVEGLEEMHPYDIQSAMDELEIGIDNRLSHKVDVPWKKLGLGAAALLVGAGVVYLIVALASSAGNSEAPGPVAETMEFTPQAEVAAVESSLVRTPMNDSVVGLGHVYYQKYRKEPEPVPVTQPEEKTLAVEGPVKPQVEKTKPVAAAPQETLEVAQVDTSETSSLLETTGPRAEKKFSFGEADSGKEKLSETPEATDENITGENEAEGASVEGKAAPAQPKGGMPAYTTYLKNSLQTTDEMPSGNVVLSFQFDKSGKPKRVNVEKSLCDACDKEAVRLIESGISWDVDNHNERVSIEVPFP